MRKLLARLDWSYFYALLGEATLGLTLIFQIFIGRLLGLQDYELFAAASALGAILALLIQFGLPVLLNREVAANPEEGAQSTIQYLLLELLTSLPVLLILFPLARLLKYEGNGILICYIVVFSEICRAMKMTLRGVLRGRGWFRGETVSVALERSATVLVAGAVLVLTRNVVWLVVAIVVVRSLDIVGLVYYLSRRLRLWSPITPGHFLETLKIAYPFAVSGVLWILYYQVDVVMLKAMAPAGEAGAYSASYRIMEMFFALPRVVFYVAFTRFAKCYANDPGRLPEQLYKSTRLLLGVVLPVVVVAGTFQNILVQIFGDEFADLSIKSLTILLPSLGISMFGNLSHRFLQATGKEKSLPPILSITTASNMGLNALLIPDFGGMGAAIATVSSEAILCIQGMSLIMRMGYQHVGKRLLVISLLSLATASCPSLIWNGLSPTIGIGIMIVGLVSLLFLMLPSQFLSGDRSDSPSDSDGV
ncbi:MAG TPA: oligosaccharide flippase family protein [Oscillatoriales cyanobacterium M59_W2019_021]|nr:MAG: flippase [Cyanobacteria bacterium J055]HIK30200.1 oligosaccharide flippase family protein [Oscillatoriales cyanobacterium M4454_W2019_049]HIK51064.1 oligosaccharide flippase family protein [Oscillatoriales cyanobacterium M59_W2019_021]